MSVESNKSQEPTSTLKQVVEAYGRDRCNPELLTQFMYAFWAEAGQRIGKEYVVSEFPLKSQEIKERIKNGQMAIFVPAEVSRIDLGKMFPKMGGWVVQEENSVVDGVNNFGWLWIEDSVDSPNRNTTQRQLEKKFKKEKRQGQSLRSYIVGSQINKLLNDKYFDGGQIWSRLLGSCRGDGVLISGFGSRGDLSVHSFLYPEDRDEFVGGRSEEVVKP
ncbi:hypothetical protein MUP46_02200 [Patescibacteria group bacterium]|nr:hypothetical protein [Patescibacteria group bacterium]